MMKKILTLTVGMLVAHAAQADRAFYDAGLDCKVVSGQARVSHVRFLSPNETFHHTVLDLSFQDGRFLILKALGSGISNRTNIPFDESSTFVADVQGQRVVANVQSYAVKSEYDRQHPTERGGYSGMRAKILTPFDRNEVEVLCEPLDRGN